MTLPETQKMFTDAWTAYKKYYQPHDSGDEAWWTQMLSDFVGITQKYPSVLARKVVDAMIEDIDERGKAVEG